MQKPPLGIFPKQIRDTQRLKEITGAVNRYFDAKTKIPLGWIEEYNELIEKQ